MTKKKVCKGCDGRGWNRNPKYAHVFIGCFGGAPADLELKCESYGGTGVRGRHKKDQENKA